MEQLNNRYRLLELVGQGGMARVYKAEDEVLGRVVAVKVLREQFASDNAFVGRFIQEARSAASLSHSNIVNVFDVGDQDGRYFIVMEYVDSVSLKDLIQKEAPFSIDQVVSVAGQICAGLQAAHGRNLIHRDIKPQNVLVTPEGQVKIADFGIARALGDASFSDTGQVFGSIHYLSPEQAQGKPATQASDVYALGIVCYEMLTGRLPFEGETVVGVALRHIQDPPRPPHELNPGIPHMLESIVLRALAKSPTERYASAKEMGQAFQAVAELGGQATGVISAVEAHPSKGRTIERKKLAPPTTTETRQPASRVKSSGNLLLFLLAMLALASIIGLCALGSAVVQTYNGKFALDLPAPKFSLPSPTATLDSLVRVPEVEGKEAAEARLMIDAAGLVYREGPPEFSDSFAEGRVIRQSIQPSTTVVAGLDVMVVVSKGPASVEVPPVVGLKYAEARAKLEGMGFSVVPQEQGTRGTAPDTVLDQEPKAGARLVRGSTVTLQVSKASNKTLVPDVVGLPEADAKKAIADAGLRNSPWPNYQGHDVLPAWLVESVPIGHVLSTKPPAGTEVDLGTEISMGVRKD